MADCIIGIPSFGMVSIHWTMSLTSIAMPMNFTNQFSLVLNKRIDEARNEIVERTLTDTSNPRFLFFLDDDVIMPPDTIRKFVHRMENLPPDVGAISGVYYSKCEPCEPLIFEEKGRGSFYDWKMGDFFQTWAAGCGLVLLRTQALQDMEQQQGRPWFLVDYGLHKRDDGVYEARSITEDLYFYEKMRNTIAPNGKPYSLWIDTTVQAQHFEKNSNKFFGLRPEEPQAQGKAIVSTLEKPALLWVGAGDRKDDLFGCDVTRVDALKELGPDVVATGDSLPFADSSFDILYSAYLLHTFPPDQVVAVLAEWNRVLKDDGKIWIKLPDINYGIAKSKENPDLAMEILYRAQCGMNKEIAKAYFARAGFSDFYIFNNGAELSIIARKQSKGAEDVA